MAHAEVEERQLLKAMTWWDGFVVALANPGFLIAALGASIGVLGTTGAFVLWTISVLLGALQNNVYAEMATMFPQKAGGISLYAHEAWRKYLSFIGPIATFGYWFAWSSVLAINGYVIGTLVQAEWFENTTFTQDVGNFQWSLPVWIGIGCIIAVWLFNIYGVRPAVWLSYVTGGLLILPAAVLMFLPYITGDWSSDNMTWAIGSGGGLGLALTWLYFMGWSAYGFETVAAFAPEYHNPEMGHARGRCAPRRPSRWWSTPCCRSASAERSAPRPSPSDATAIAFYTQAFDVLVGNALANVLVVCLIAGLLLSMNTATMDGSRALYGISQDGMTTKWLGRLNSYSVPGIAMTVDVVLNLFLISYFGYPLDILAAGNLGYMLAHVFALSGFLLLRTRPVRTGRGRSSCRLRGCRSRACWRRSTCCSSSPARSSTPTSTATAGTRRGSASACSPSGCCSTSGAGSWRTGRASRCARRRPRCHRIRRPPRLRPPRPSSRRPLQA